MAVEWAFEAGYRHFVSVYPFLKEGERWVRVS